MSIGNKAFKINNYVLASSGEVLDLVEEVLKLQSGRKLIHIVSFMHNTVLVQNLKKELEKVCPGAELVLLKHSDKKNTAVTVFTLAKESDAQSISNEILNELHLDSGNKALSIKEYRNQLFSRYFTDHLTNLPNVYQLRKDLQDNHDYSLVILNIDNFQTINNFYGFLVGDFVIEELGNYLKKHINDCAIYRLSGDEFAFVIDKNMGFYDLRKYISNLYATLNDIVLVYQDIKIFIDITLASCVNNASNHVFSKVSMALKYAKDNGLSYWIYEDRMNFENEYERNLKLSGLVRRAVGDSKIIPYYQAIVDNKTLEVVKYECLARLIDHNGRLLSPMLFIPVAKKIKVYNQVTKTIIDKSFATFENTELEFNINLSIEDIMNSTIFDFLVDKLKNSKASSRVTFEILESEAVQDFKKVERFISEIKRYGAKIAIDDFGSGYSNFSYLTKMYVDYIKIDGSLIENIDVDKSSLAVVETIVSFAKKLGLKTIAEYVHSSVIMDVVKSLGIDYSQGYYIDKPSINAEVTTT